MGWVHQWVGLGWVMGPQVHLAVGWVGLGQLFGGLGWVSVDEMDPRTTLVQLVPVVHQSGAMPTRSPSKS